MFRKYLLLLMLPHILGISEVPTAGMPPTAGPLPQFQSQRMEFSEETRTYFEKELTLPGAPHSIPSSHIGKAKIHVATSILSGTWKITFLFPEPVTFTQEIDEKGNLYLDFNQSIDSPDLLPAVEELGYVFKRFSSGLHALYLVPTRPSDYFTEAIDTQFTLEILPRTECFGSSTAALKIAQARLFIERRHYVSAFCLLGELKEEYPYHYEVDLLHATLRGLLPQWQKNVALLENLVEEYPFNQDMKILLRDAFFPHTSTLFFEQQMQRTVGLAAEQIYQGRYEQILNATPCNYLYGGVFFQAERGHIASIFNNQGESVGFLGTRSQIDAYLRNELENGNTYSGHFYVEEGGVYGAGTVDSWLIPCIEGQMTLLAAWNRPYWEVFETLADFGREAILTLQFEGTLSRYFSWSLRGGGHRVGIRDVSNGFTSALLSGQLFWNWFLANPIFTLNYALDAEYVIQEATRNGVGGPYNPVPLTTYEYHSFRGYLFYEWDNRWFLTLFYGLTVNRFGIHNPTGGVEMKYKKPCPCGLEIDFSAYKFPSTVVQGAAVDYLTTTVTLHF